MNHFFDEVKQKIVDEVVLCNYKCVVPNTSLFFQFSSFLKWTSRVLLISL